MYLAKELLGLEDLVVPGEDIRNNVLADISQMENEQMQPDPNQMPQQLIPMPGQPPPQVPMISSIQPDTSYFEDDDWAVAFRTVKHWIYSPTGQRAKTSQSEWYKNVVAYGNIYKQGKDAAEQAAADAQKPPMPPPPPIPPMGVSAKFESLTPEAQAAELARRQDPSTTGTIHPNAVPEPPQTGA